MTQVAMGQAHPVTQVAMGLAHLTMGQPFIQWWATGQAHPVTQVATGQARPVTQVATGQAHLMILATDQDQAPTERLIQLQTSIMAAQAVLWLPSNDTVLSNYEHLISLF